MPYNHSTSYTMTQRHTITLYIIQSLDIIHVLDIIKTLQKYNVLTTYKYWSRIGFRPDSLSLKIIFSEKIWNVSQSPSTEVSQSQCTDRRKNVDRGRIGSTIPLILKLSSGQTYVTCRPISVWWYKYARYHTHTQYKYSISYQYIYSTSWQDTRTDKPFKFARRAPGSS